MSSSKTLHFDDANFEDQVLKSDQPVRVDFWAPWCGPCRAVAPVVDALAERLEGRARVGKLNVDEAREIASRFHIRSIPTFGVFKDGSLVDHTVGVASEKQLEALVVKHTTRA